MDVYSQALGMKSSDNDNDGIEVSQESYCEKLQNAMFGMGIGEHVWGLSRLVAQSTKHVRSGAVLLIFALWLTGWNEYRFASYFFSII